MMGYQDPFQGKLFYPNLQLDKRIRPNHPLRKIAALIDFEFVYKEVEAAYGDRGNVSVPPPVILKLMLLLVLYNVRSERELMDTLPERLDWLWFLGYDLDSRGVKSRLGSYPADVVVIRRWLRHPAPDKRTTD